MEEHGMLVKKTVDEPERSNHEKFLRLAIQLAEENVEHGLGGPFGCNHCSIPANSFRLFVSMIFVF